MAEAQPVSPRPASVVVVARDLPGSGGIEVFMVRRHIRSEFVPDAFVFPGGSITPDDAESERVPGLCARAPEGPTALGSGFRTGALRECFEEAGILLARRNDQLLAIAPDDVARFAGYREALFHHGATLAQIAEQEGLSLATDMLLHWAHWITPEALPKRFDTHFFLAPMPEQQEAAHDQLETTDSVWITPAEALRRFAEGQFPIVFATIHQLRELEGLASVADAYQRYTGTVPRTIMPRVTQRDGANVIVLPGEEESAS